MSYIWTDHIESQLIKRKIQKDTVLSAIHAPDSIVGGEQGRRVYQKKIGGKLLRVVVDGQKLITVYLTNKISKYSKG